MLKSTKVYRITKGRAVQDRCGNMLQLSAGSNELTESSHCSASARRTWCSHTDYHTRKFSSVNIAGDRPFRVHKFLSKL